MKNSAPTLTEQMIESLASKGIALPAGAGPDEILSAICTLDAAQKLTPTVQASPVSQSPTRKIMTNPLIGCDPKEVSPARAGAAFAEFAKKMATEQGMDLTAAWNRAKLLHPDLHARMLEATPAQPADASPLENGAAAGVLAASALRSGRPLITGAFHLPANVDDQVLDAAYRANGSLWTRVDLAKVFSGLVVFYAQRRDISVAVARTRVRDDFPDLARAAGQATDA